MYKALTTLAVLAALVTGCATMPTPESVQVAAYASGQIAAFAASTSKKFTPEVKAATIVVLTELNLAVPTNGQSVAQAWTPVIIKTVDSLVAQGKLTPAFKPVVIAFGTTLALAVDAELSRHPDWKTAENYVTAVCGGFTSGARDYFTAFTATNTFDPDKVAAAQALVKSQGL